MSAPIPVLQALIHSPWYFRDESRPMDEQAMGDDWHVRTALALERAFPGRFALECWRPDWREPVERTACVSGLTCRIFPSRRAAFGKFLCEVSPAMFAALWRRARRERFVLHVHEMHSATGMLAAFLPSGAVKAAHTHGSPPVGLRLENAASPSSARCSTRCGPWRNLRSRATVASSPSRTGNSPTCARLSCPPRN